MSSISLSNFDFSYFENRDNELIEDSSINWQEPSFYQTKNFSRILEAVCWITMAIFTILATKKWGFSGFFAAIVVDYIASLIPAGIHRNKCYYDPSQRKKFREELESGQITPGKFIAKHGLSNIRYFGLYLRSNEEPIFRKEMLEKFCLDLIDEDEENHFWCDRIILIDLERLDNDDAFLLTNGLLWNVLKLTNAKVSESIKEKMRQKLCIMPYLSIVVNFAKFEKQGVFDLLSETQVALLKKHAQIWEEDKEKLREKKALFEPLPIVLWPLMIVMIPIVVLKITYVDNGQVTYVRPDSGRGGGMRNKVFYIDRDFQKDLSEKWQKQKQEFMFLQ